MSGFASRLAEAIENLVRNGIIINPIEILIQLLATVILIFVVKKYLWSSVTDFLEARQAVVDEDIKTAQDNKLKAKSLREKAQKELDSVKAESRAILESAKKQAANLKSESLTKTEEELALMKKNAETQLAKELENAKKSLREEIISVAMVLAEKVIAKEIDEKTYHALIDDAIKEVSNR